MNEFEIKATKQALKHLNIKEIYNVSKEYNIKEYGEVFFQRVAQFEYKGMLFYAYHGDIYSKGSKNEELIKSAVNQEIKEVDYYFYEARTTEEVQTGLVEFTANQIEIQYVKRQKFIGDVMDSIFDKVQENVEQGIKDNKEPIQLYKECIKEFKMSEENE